MIPLPTFTDDYGRPLDDGANYQSLNHVRGTHTGNWFAPETIDYWGTQIIGAPQIVGGRFFVTSEPTEPNGFVRRFTVRVAKADGSVHTVGGFGTFANGTDAYNAAIRLTKALRHKAML